ncbi:SDR family NAD(P)-dependent oxidoreductase [Candidatus Poriferisocius sp.]|uniref:SDR family NAD(P)-dependent oxidoreductase n=1 Tax=Candidatus Poriferisocius sp. TaxID=3101276 RepID=UPI003B024945
MSNQTQQASSPVALVTGASRGIGRATALALADAGFDVAITARTVREGEGIVAQPTTDAGGDVAVPGSLDTTAAEITERGQRVLPITMDLLSAESVRAAADTALSEWGRVDVLVNNAIWSGPGLLDPVGVLDLEALDTAFTANVLRQVLLTQLILPSMVERGSGLILNLTSSAGQVDDPPYEVVKMKMLGYAHCASKGAFHRMAPLIQAEHELDGITAINIDPGFTWTESMAALDLHNFGGAPPEATGTVIAWLTEDPERTAEWRGRTLSSLELCAQLGLVEGWPPEGSQ